MNPALLRLLVAAALAWPVHAGLSLADGTICAYAVTMGGWYLGRDVAPYEPCPAVQLALLTRFRAPRYGKAPR